MEVLIVKIGAIGDAVMALGAAQWMKTTYPDARITWLGGERILPLLQSTDVVDQIVSVNEDSLFGSHRLKSLKALGGVWRTLLGRKFDLAIVGHTDWRYRMLLLSTRLSETRMFGLKNGRAFPVPGRYHGDEYLRLVSGEDSWKMPVFTFPILNVPDLSSSMEDVLGPQKNPWILLVPGSAKNHLADDPLRRWPVHFYSELAKNLISKGNKVILAGGKSDLWVREWFRDAGTIDPIGKTDLMDLMALVSRSDVVVAHDSGPLHLAVILERPLVALFGPTNPKEKLPQQGRSPIRLLWNGNVLPCAPCYDGKQFAHCDRNVCLEMISVKDAEESIAHLLPINRDSSSIPEI